MSKITDIKCLLCTSEYTHLVSKSDSIISIRKPIETKKLRVDIVTHWPWVTNECTCSLPLTCLKIAQVVRLCIKIKHIWSESVEKDACKYNIVNINISPPYSLSLELFTLLLLYDVNSLSQDSFSTLVYLITIILLYCNGLAFN